MLKSFKFRIYPTSSQERKLLGIIKLCQELYNGALQERIAYYKTFGKSLSLYDQIISLPKIKEICPEYKEVYSQVLRDPLTRLDKGYKNFFRRVKAGDAPGFPRFQSCKRYSSFTYPQSGFRINKDRLHLSKLGAIKISLHREIVGKIKACTIIKSFTNKWYACFACEISEQALPKTGRAIGIDLGIKNYIVSSDNEVVDNPKTLNKYLMKLAKASRRHSKKKSNASRLHTARLHEKVVNIRTDWQHKVANQIVKNYDIIILEKLNIQNMQVSKTLGSNMKRHISDASWGRLIQFISYKAEYADKQVVLVDPANTSKMCSRCGNIKNNLSLSDRTYRCDQCGLETDRDFNASLNIKAKGLAILAKPESRNIPSAVKVRSSA